MKNIYPLEYLEKTFAVKQYITLFSQFIGNDIQMIDVNCSPISFVCSNRRGNCKCEHKTENCQIVSENFINELKTSRKPKIYTCPGWLRKIFVPLFLDDEILGLLVLGEDSSFRFNGTNIGALSELLLHLTNYIFKNESNPLNRNGQSKITHQQEVLGKVTLYMRKNYNNKNLSLQDVSQKNGISYHYLSHLFKKELNITFAQYRKKVKMEVASKLLKHRRLTISQVSYACGYDDPGYFSKVFKMVYGVSPEYFRKK